MEPISAVSNKSIPFTHIIRASYTGSRVSVPVSTATSLYTRFRHITGIPSTADSGKVTVSRLRQLDIMIDQLSRIRDRDMDLDIGGKESGEIEKMIARLSSDLRSALTSKSADYFPGIYEPGSILNHTA